MSVFCPSCRTENLDSSRFCINCGATLSAACRKVAAEGEMRPLTWFADRLEGQMAAGEGDLDQAILLLRASADGFGMLGATWEEAYSNLLLAEAIGKEGRLDLYRSRLLSGLATFQRLGSVREIDRASELVDRISS